MSGAGYRGQPVSLTGAICIARWEHGSEVISERVGGRLSATRLAGHRWAFLPILVYASIELSVDSATFVKRGRRAGDHGHSQRMEPMRGPGCIGSHRRLEEGLAERDLIDRAKRGDGRAYESLVRQYQDLAFRTACLITDDAQDAEDATQSAFLKAYVHLSRFRSDAPFRPWILQIVANEAKNARRAHQRHLLRAGADLAATDVPAGDPAMETCVIARERSAWLVAHIEALSEADRVVIYCRYALDLTEAETASVLDCARGTVKSRLHRAVGRLRERLEHDDQDVEDHLAGESP